MNALIDEKELCRLKQLSIYEQQYRENGFVKIGGIDEVGRGPLAGPVIAACVILPDDFLLCGINDSKKIPKKKHEAFYRYITGHCIDHAAGIVEPDVIDSVNILNATKIAMQKAYEAIKTKPDVLFIDHLALEAIPICQLSLTKGDSLSVSIAAASLIAKYIRDKLMKEYAMLYPEYGFDKNAGYGTKDHIDAIRKYGICEIHRKSFVKKFI